MIDVHVLTMPHERRDWLKQCLNSMGGEPVNVRVLPGKLDDLGGARADAFMVGDCEYVSFVDPDDYVLPGGFQACVSAMEKEGSIAACTGEYITGVSGKIIDHNCFRSWVHHLIVLKRSVVENLVSVWRAWDHKRSTASDGRYFIEYLLNNGHRVSFINRPYYVWRKHTNADSIRRIKLRG
jgi:hypothetical protein